MGSASVTPAAAPAATALLREAIETEDLPQRKRGQRKQQDTQLAMSFGEQREDHV